MASFLSCFASLVSPPASSLSPQEAHNLPVNQLLSRSFDAAPNLTDPTLRQQVASAIGQHQSAQPMVLINDVLQAARNSMTVSRDKEILDMAQAFISTIVTSSSQGQQAPDRHVGTHQGQHHPPAQGGGSYAGAVGKPTAPTPYHPQPQHHASSHAAGGNGAPSNVFVHPFFFPSEDSFNQLRRVIDSADRTLDVCVFSITDNHLATALIQAKRRGVAVRLISDDDQTKGLGSDVIRLGEEEGIPYVLDNNPSHMHNKFAIGDNSVVLTGSYNWTKAARFDNRENILITNDPQAVAAYAQEFNKLWCAFGGKQ